MELLDGTLDLLGGSWHFFFFKKTALLRYNLHAVQLNWLEVYNPVILEYIYSCAVITTIQF